MAHLTPTLSQVRDKLQAGLAKSLEIDDQSEKLGYLAGTIHNAVQDIDLLLALEEVREEEQAMDASEQASEDDHVRLRSWIK